MRCSWVALGLGNPEQPYGRTRHNAGIGAIKVLLSGVSGGCFELAGRSFRALVNRDRLYALQRCYMNESFLVVDELKTMGIQVDQWLVVHDDLAIELGRIRVVRSGRSGGHHGVEGISQALGSDQFARVKIGIAPRAPVDGSAMRDFVLNPFSKDELPVLHSALPRAASAALCVMDEGVGPAMDRFNASARDEGP